MTFARIQLVLVVALLGCLSTRAQDHSAGPLPKLESFAVAEAPAIDGRADDAVWNRARPVRVTARVVWPEPKSEGIPVVIKSVHTAERIFLLMRWEDATKDDVLHKPWVWNADRNTYEEGPDREDMLALAFEHTGAFSADMLAGEPSAWDVWHWKATRTDAQGHAMDKTHRYALEKPSGKARSYEARNGETIWIARPEDAGDTLESKQAAPTEHRGDRVPRYLPGTPSGSAADVRAKGVWADGWWTLELERRLDTGHPDDTAFDTGRTYRMAVSAHDRTGDMDKASGVIELAFVPSLPTGGISRITGVQGTLLDGEYKIAVPQGDLDVEVDGFPIIPPMGTTSWVVFMPMGAGAMIMGDVVLLEYEFQPVQKVLVEADLRISAIHNHQDGGSGQEKEQAAAVPEPGLELGYGEGFYLRSADRRNEIVVEGLFQVGLNVFQRNRGRVSQFDLRRMRPELSGRLADAFVFRVEPNFQDDGVELEEAWVGLDLARRSARLMAGRMKAPFNLEEVRSRRHINFPRFSILNQFAPAEDHGVFLIGKTAGDGLEYGLAVYNGTGASDTTSSKDVAARLAVHPFAGEADSALANLHLGLAATWGRQDEDVGGDSIVNAFDQDVIDFAAGTRLDGDRLRLGVELAWFSGPWMLQSELIWVRQEMSRGGLSHHVDFYGAYVDASWVLTGEERRGWAGVRPASPVDPVGLTGTGAWVLALRASDLVSDTALPRSGFTDPGLYTEHVRSLSVGLNWVLNDHLIVRHAYVHSFYSDDVLLGGSPRSDEGAVMIEWQMHF